MKQWFIIACAVLLTAGATAQDPLHWAFSAKKIAEGKYEVHLKASVEDPWHTYSQLTPDGGPIPTKITYGKNPLLKIDGDVKEVGDLKIIHDKIFDVDVKYFHGDVDFVQVVQLKAKAKTRISGTINYMVCNDRQCLPPQTATFNIPLQ